VLQKAADAALVSSEVLSPFRLLASVLPSISSKGTLLKTAKDRAAAISDPEDRANALLLLSEALAQGERTEYAQEALASLRLVTPADERLHALAAMLPRFRAPVLQEAALEALHLLRDASTVVLRTQILAWIAASVPELPAQDLAPALREAVTAALVI